MANFVRPTNNSNLSRFLFLPLFSSLLSSSLFPCLVFCTRLAAPWSTWLPQTSAGFLFTSSAGPGPCVLRRMSESKYPSKQKDAVVKQAGVLASAYSFPDMPGDKLQRCPMMELYGECTLKKFNDRVHIAGYDHDFVPEPEEAPSRPVAATFTPAIEDAFARMSNKNLQLHKDARYYRSVKPTPGKYDWVCKCGYGGYHNSNDRPECWMCGSERDQTDIRRAPTRLPLETRYVIPGETDLLQHMKNMANAAERMP
eukprot:g1396.t1